ncbi:MAG: twitch domain-containing radical SAM protein [Paracoccaceae bacterium]
MNQTTPKRPLCAAPFGSMSISASGQVRPCCLYEGDLGTLRDGDMQSHWNGKPFAALRTAMERGEKVEACWKCWSAEDAGLNSLRMDFNRHFADILEDGQRPENPVHLDLRYSNLCNFRCRSCHHGASSRWFSDAKALGINLGSKPLLSAFSSAKDGLEQFQKIGSEVRTIYFAGGEPLLERQNADMLQWLIDEGRTNINLAYNSNLSVLEVEKTPLLPLWNQFRNVSIEASIDAAYAAGALVRSGFDWAQFVANIAQLRAACPHVVLTAGVTVSALNLARLAELFVALERDCAITHDKVKFHALQLPAYYDVTILPADLREKAAVDLAALGREHAARHTGSVMPARFRKLIARLEPDSIGYQPAHIKYLRSEFRQMTKKLDKLRSEDTAKTLPELAGLLTAAD